MLFAYRIAWASPIKSQKWHQKLRSGKIEPQGAHHEPRVAIDGAETWHWAQSKPEEAKECCHGIEVDERKFKLELARKIAAPIYGTRGSLSLDDDRSLGPNEAAQKEKKQEVKERQGEFE